jgi:hypothetical protein
MIATLFTFGKKGKKNVKIFTDNEVRDEIFRRSVVNSIARKEALNAKNAPVVKVEPKQTKTSTAPNPHAATIQKLDEILTKVSGFDNTKIATIAELANALETGSFTNLIKLLKTKDKVVAKKKATKKTWEL